MTSHTDGIATLARHFSRFAGNRSGLLLLAMVATAFSEGFGLLLLIPLMSLTGISSAVQADGSVIGGLPDWASQFGESAMLATVLAVFLILVVVRQLLVYHTAQLAATTRNDYIGHVREELFAAIGDTEWRFLTGGRLDQLSQIILMDSVRIGEAALNLVRILSAATLLLANAAVAVLLAPQLAFAVLAAITVLTVLLGNRLAVVRGQGRNVSQIQDDMLRVVENYVDCIRVAKLAGTAVRIQDQFSATIQQLNAELSGFVRQSESTKLRLQIASAAAIAVAVMSAVSVFGAKGPELLLLILIAARFVPRVASVNQYAHALFNCVPAFEHMQSMLRYCALHREQEPCHSEAIVARESICLQAVTVLSASDPSRVVLEDVSFCIRVPEIIGLSGASGAGKSTLADVLSGLVQADRGAILIDGAPIGRDQAAAWRKSVGYVSQRAALLQASIAHNLQWALTGPTSTNELDDALRCVAIDEVIKKLPDGLNTILDRREGTLSGGERQRLAIARELLRQPQLLILDEATHALDAETEKKVLRNIRRCHPQISVLLISHRATALSLADRIVHLHAAELIDDTQRGQASR